MTALLTLRPLRAAMSQIGSAVNASQEYSRAIDPRCNREATGGAREWARYIPL